MVTRKTKERKPSCDIRLDVFKNGETAHGLRREIFTAVKKSDEEYPIDPKQHFHKLQLEHELMEEVMKEPVEPQTKREFVRLPWDALKCAKNFTHKFSDVKDPVVWETLAADEEIDECPRFELPLESLSDGPTISKRIDFENCTNSELFLAYFWLARHDRQSCENGRMLPCHTCGTLHHSERS